MTRQQRRELTWPLVALAAIVAAFLLGVLVLIPKDAPELRTALVGALVTAVGGIITGVLRSMDRKMDDNSGSVMSRERDDRP